MTTTHNLPFETAKWIMPDFTRFRVGTVDGIFGFDKDNYSILGITNSSPGNGHLEDVFQWFENSCQRDNKNFCVLEVWNEDFKSHLIHKRGFEIIPNTCHVIKHFKS